MVARMIIGAAISALLAILALWLAAVSGLALVQVPEAARVLWLASCATMLLSWLISRLA